MYADALNASRSSALRAGSMASSNGILEEAGGELVIGDLGLVEMVGD
jgi:hypothetical protein